MLTFSPSVVGSAEVLGLALMLLGVGYHSTCTPPVLTRFSFIANIMMQVNGKDARTVKDSLANEHGIMVRHYQKKMLDGFIRISVGRPEHTDALITALQNMV